MRFTSHSTRTQIVLLNAFNSVPKSCKNQLKWVSETTSFSAASAERFLLWFWDPKFIQNLLKINPKLPCTPKTLGRWPKMLPRCLPILHKPTKNLARGSKSLPKRFKIGPTKLSRRLLSITMQNYKSLFAVCTSQAPQLALRSFQDTLFDTNAKCSTHDL